jgi:hypothetical protein
MRKSTPATGPNLLDLKPQRNLEWETKENEIIVLLVPKFQNAILVAYLLPRLSKPNIRLELDAYGSYVWQQCDGQTTVFEIAERMKSKFGGTVDPSYDRIGKFIRQLLHNKFIRFE